MAETLVLNTIRSGFQDDTALMALVSGVYEVVPETVEPPYITINRLRLMDDSTKTSFLYSLSVDLTIWDQSTSSKTSRSILARIRELVPSLQPTSGQFIGLTIRDTDLMRDRAMNWIRTGVMLQGNFVP